jgi:hypothetical protein
LKVSEIDQQQPIAAVEPPLSTRALLTGPLTVIYLVNGSHECDLLMVEVGQVFSENPGNDQVAPFISWNQD